MYRFRNRKSPAFLLGLALTTQALVGSASLAAGSADLQAQVTQGKAELAKGKLDSAITILGKAAKTMGTTPGSCDCHFNLGMAFSKRANAECKTDKAKATSDFLAAKKELKSAIKVGHGNVISTRANEFMMKPGSIPKELLAPKVGEGTEMIAARLGLRSADRGISATAKPRVYEFYAAWCEPCQKLKPVLDKMKTQYGDQIDVQSINVDDKNAAEMVDQYDVSPIPTIIYLNADGQVVSYSIGFSDERNVQKEIEKILPAKG